MLPLALPTIVKLTVVLHILVCCRASQDTYSIEIDSRNGSCPPWYYHDDEDKCSFSHQLPQIVNQYGNTSELEMGYCMTQTNSSLVVSPCPYIPTTPNFSQYHSIYQVLPKQLDQVNDSLCAAFNRKGFLCSECKENYGLAAYRYYGLMCVKCSGSAWNWVTYILLLFVPPTILFMVLLVVNINVHSGALTGFIFFSHTITSTAFFFPSLFTLSQSLFGYWPVQILLALYGIWDLDFMQFVVSPFCVTTTLTTLQLVSLGYVSSVYSLVLCMATYCLIELHVRGNWLLVKIWLPFRKFFINYTNIQFSVLHSMATFILLSYGKNFFVSFTLFQLNTSIELDISTNSLKPLPPRSVDLRVPYFGATHVPYAVLGLLGCIITVILPLVLVIIYPTCVFPKLIRCFGLRRWHAVRTFLEVFVGSFKGGTNASEGKRDYRLFAAVYLIGRILTGVGWTKRTVSNQTIQQYNWIIAAVPFVVVAVVFAYIKPHRKWYHNLVNVLLFLLMSKMCVCLHIIFETITSDYVLQILVLILVIDLAIPQLVVIIYFCFKLISWGYLQDVKQLGRNCIRNEDEEETLPQLQQSSSESLPLLQ